jgi:hypothetical protein
VDSLGVERPARCRGTSLRAVNKGYSSSSLEAGHYVVMIASNGRPYSARSSHSKRTNDVRVRNPQGSSQITLRNPTDGSGITIITHFDATATFSLWLLIGDGHWPFQFSAMLSLSSCIQAAGPQNARSHIVGRSQPSPALRSMRWF